MKEFAENVTAYVKGLSVTEVSEMAKEMDVSASTLETPSFTPGGEDDNRNLWTLIRSASSSNFYYKSTKRNTKKRWRISRI